MHTRIYVFTVKSAQHDNFVKAWKEMTGLLVKHAGGLGSRLHKVSDSQYLAYAQWPDKGSWIKAGKQLPPHAEIIRQRMRTTCKEIKTLYEMEVIEDLLKEL